MRRVTGLFLCVVCVFVFSAYDWGRKSKTQTPPQETKQVTPAPRTVTVPATTAVSRTTAAQRTYARVEQPVVPAPRQVSTEKKSRKNSMPVAEAKTPPAQPDVAAPAANANDKAVAIVTLAKIVGSGTPEERKARIESLKRLSQALAESQGQKKV